MGCVTIIDKEKDYFCFACNTTDVAFGPLFWVDPDTPGFIDDLAADFLEFLGKDPRLFKEGELIKKWLEFRGDEE